MIVVDPSNLKWGSQWKNISSTSLEINQWQVDFINGCKLIGIILPPTGEELVLKLGCDIDHVELIAFLKTLSSISNSELVFKGYTFAT